MQANSLFHFIVLNYFRFFFTLKFSYFHFKRYTDCQQGFHSHLRCSPDSCRHPDVVHDCKQRTVCWPALCTTGAMSAAAVAANFSDYITTTKKTTSLISRSIFLFASSLLQVLFGNFPSSDFHLPCLYLGLCFRISPSKTWEDIVNENYLKLSEVHLIYGVSVKIREAKHL